MRNLTAALIALAVPLVASAQEPVALQQKFTLGQEAAYHLSATGMASIETDAPPGVGIPAGDLQFDVNADFTQRVEALGEGWAELAFRLQQASATASLMAGPAQLEFRLKLPEGEFEMLFNGQPAPQEQKPEEMAPLLKLVQMPLLVRMDAAGRVVRLPQLDLLTVMVPGLDFDAMQANSTGFLPTQAVKVGDAWQQRQALPIALPAPDGAEQREIVVDYTLKELTKLAGRDVARIGVDCKFALGDMRGFRWPGKPEPKRKEGAAKREPAGLEGLDIEETGDIYFDLNDGQIVKAELSIIGNISFSGWEKPDKQPGAQAPADAEQPAPVLTHTTLSNIDLTVTLERVG